MPEVAASENLEPNDPLASSATGAGFAISGDLASICGGLRRCAVRAAQTLHSANHEQVCLRGQHILQDLAYQVAATDVHLYRIAVDAQETGLVGLRLNSSRTATDDQLQMLKRFQFGLLSTGVRTCMRFRKIARIAGQSTTGGRILTSMLQQVPCDAYYLIPLYVNGRLRGALGIAFSKEPSPAEPHTAELFELLKLNGLILLSQLLRVYQERNRRRRFQAWRRLADQACDFAMTIDQDFRIQQTVVFGAQTEIPDLNGLRLVDVVLRAFHRQLHQQIDTAIQTSVVRTIDFQLLIGHSGPRWYVARIEPSAASTGNFVTLYLTDNHPDKLLQEQVRELSDRLLRASRLSLLGQMSTEFAHQLNQPLQAILNYCNLIQRRIQKDTDTPETSLACLENIEKSVQHSATLIQRIRDFVKFRSLQTEEVRLQEIIEQATLMVQPTALSWGAEIILEDTPTPSMVLADRTQTTHVLVNLMVNSLEACRESQVSRPRVEIQVQTDVSRQLVLVSICDNGPGLPVKDPEIVFRQFYSGRKDGLGMGLAISRDVCESQGGSLSAENNSSGVGCTFRISVPLLIHQPPCRDTQELRQDNQNAPLID